MLTLFTFAGEPLLGFFGNRLAAFSVAGGLLLLLLALSMVEAHVSPQRQTEDEALEAEEKDSVGVVPLGVPRLAGPRAITHVIVASSAAQGDVLHQGLLLIPVALGSAPLFRLERCYDKYAHLLKKKDLRHISPLVNYFICHSGHVVYLGGDVVSNLYLNGWRRYKTINILGILSCAEIKNALVY